MIYKCLNFLKYILFNVYLLFLKLSIGKLIMLGILNLYVLFYCDWNFLNIIFDIKSNLSNVKLYL